MTKQFERDAIEAFLKGNKVAVAMHVSKSNGAVSYAGLNELSAEALPRMFGESKDAHGERILDMRKRLREIAV